MWFVDQATITVHAGDGGRGCAAFSQPPYTRAPYPDGGNGGDGGDVLIAADHNIATLLDFQFRHEFRGGRGGHGSGNNRTGRCGADCVIRVPAGTLIKDRTSGELLRDLRRANERVTVAAGGRGGVGNANASEAQPGGEGERRELLLELKLIADVGLVGFPNAGKSSLLARISTAKPKIASYPFTTRYPVLGVVRLDPERVFVACDIPGLIEGAHAGRGLGFQFLRHIERTRILVHVVDCAGEEHGEPAAAFARLNEELAAYSPALAARPQVVAANKMDLPDARDRLDGLRAALGRDVHPISCATGYGVPELMEEVWRTLSALAPSGQQA
ncbi:MAG TPA: Obg family GTPase CgtA [bacterium]